MMIYGVVIVGIVVLWAGIWFYRHQKLLEERAFLLREAVRNRDFAHRLPVKGLFFGERALQRTVNDLSEDISRLLAQNEVESWQRLTRVLTHEIMNATAPISSISQAYLNHPKIKGSFYEEGIRAIYETSCGLSAFVDSYRKLTSLQEPNLEEVVLCPFVESVRALYPDLEWHLNIEPSVILSLDENMWRQVHILEWEKVHGPIPKGMCLTFLDGNRRNLALDNLMLISRRENRVMNMNWNNDRTHDGQITKANIAIRRIDEKVRKVAGKEE